MGKKEIIKVEEKISGERIDSYLAKRLELTRTRVQELIKEEQIKVNYKKIKSYKNGIKPGIIFLEQDKIDTKFIDFILLRHFNFELAKEPSLNIKVQFFIKFDDQFSMLFDIYDDRGFYAYYL